MNAGTLHPNRFTNSRFPLASPLPMTLSPLRFLMPSLRIPGGLVALLVPVLVAATLVVRPASAQDPASALRPIAIAIHGGAGTILRERMTPECCDRIILRGGSALACRSSMAHTWPESAPDDER